LKGARLITGVVTFICGYGTLDTQYMTFSIGIMAAGLYLGLTGLYFLFAED